MVIVRTVDRREDDQVFVWFLIFCFLCGQQMSGSGRVAGWMVEAGEQRDGRAAVEPPVKSWCRWRVEC
eukprot:800300-Amphidinium_carterae.1